MTRRRQLERPLRRVRTRPGTGNRSAGGRHYGYGLGSVAAAGRAPGFSLVELVVALGLCAVALTSVLGLLAAAARDAAAIQEMDTATRIFSAVQAELVQADFAAVRAALVAAGTPVDAAPAFFASRDGTRLGPDGAVEPAARYFGIVFERDAGLSPAAEDGDAGFLAFQVRIEWPVHLPNGAWVDSPRRTVRRFPAALRR